MSLHFVFWWVGVQERFSELKEFIDNQVLVTCDDSGSHVEVIV